MVVDDHHLTKRLDAIPTSVDNNVKFITSPMRNKSSFDVKSKPVADRAKQAQSEFKASLFEANLSTLAFVSYQSTMPSVSTSLPLL
ncbi:hypothetical protein L6452_36036 [Arctium lappa]|uniref:Uncharacterized protein n=1 Tax=Arctium lappa TaxID=4217 RepID=A0ACB8Y9J4_ARCLA|nr:hypothetical protein L6452_36036 [Arctium lappa]